MQRANKRVKKKKKGGKGEGREGERFIELVCYFFAALLIRDGEKSSRFLILFF